MTTGKRAMNPERFGWCDRRRCLVRLSNDKPVGTGSIGPVETITTTRVKPRPTWPRQGNRRVKR